MVKFDVTIWVDPKHDAYDDTECSKYNNQGHEEGFHQRSCKETKTMLDNANGEAVKAGKARLGQTKLDLPLKVKWNNKLATARTTTVVIMRTY